jgi:hypothetical protein
MAAGFRSTEHPCCQGWRCGAADLDDDGDVELVPQAAPTCSPALAAAAQPPPVDEGDVDLAVLEAGLLPDDDGSLDYQQAAEMLWDADNFEADVDSGMHLLTAFLPWISLRDLFSIKRSR